MNEHFSVESEEEESRMVPKFVAWAVSKTIIWDKDCKEVGL